MKALDLKNQKFGRLRALNYEYSKHKKHYWKCECDCGNNVIVCASQLSSGKTKSCGCLRKEVAKQTAMQTHTTHGLTRTKIYNIWSGIKKRCYKENYVHYKNYGGRGITVCEEWKNDFINFYNWAIENGYKDNLTIDRINVNGNYEPSNCRWITIKEQQNNKRNNIFLTHNGTTKSIYEWSKITGIKYCTIWWRHKNNWDINKILERNIK